MNGSIAVIDPVGVAGIAVQLRPAGAENPLRVIDPSIHLAADSSGYNDV